MIFWFLVITLALACGAILGLVVLRGRAGDAPPAAYDLQVYRDQLKEVDRDLARAIVSPEDAERIRAEVSRRILAADSQFRDGGETGGQPRALGLALAAAVLLVLGAGATMLYREIGTPGYRDVPLTARLAASEEARAARLSQQEVEDRLPPSTASPDVPADYMALMEKLRETVAERPEDLRGLGLLVRNEAALGNLSAAHKAQAQIIGIKGPAATADDYAQLVDLMVSAASGYVSKDAEAAIREALRRDASEPRARYYLGLYMAQVDRPDVAFRTWDRLLRESKPDAPWVPIIREQIEELAWRAGQNRYELPPLADAPGPTAEDIDAAGEMSDEDRSAMIRGMVQQLSDRLAEQGGTPEEWARLIGAYGALGEPDRARAIWSEAQQVFADAPEALATVRAAAEGAGIAE